MDAEIPAEGFATPAHGPIAAPLAAADVAQALNSAALQHLFQQQLQLMSQHLALLSGAIQTAAPARTAEAQPKAHEPTLLETVQRAMADLLQRADFGADEDFFRAGGHSLLAARLSTRLAQSGLPRAGLRAIFEQPTPRRLAGWLAQPTHAAALETASSLRVREAQSTAPLSLMQQRMWYLEQLHPGTALNNLHAAHWLRGPLNVALFRRAFEAVVQRQSVLRTHIESEGQTLRQRIRPRLDADPLHVEDLSHWAAHEREAELQRRFADWAAQPFDLLQGPLFRAVLLRLDDGLHAFLFVAHHIIWDAGSFDVLYAELAAQHAAFLQGSTPRLPALTLSYGDFAAWQQQWQEGAALQRQTAHWVQKLTPLPEPLNLPSSRQRPQRMSGSGHSFQLALSGSALDRLKRFAARQGSTLYVSLLALYALALQQLSGQNDLCIGTPVRGRERSELEPLMGFFVNMLPMRLSRSAAGELSAGDWVQQVHREVQAAFDAPDVPFEQLMRELKPPRDLSRPPLHQASFSFQDVSARPLQWGRLEMAELPTSFGASTQDLALWCVLTQEELLFAYTYNTELWDEADCRLFAERLLHMVQRLPDVALLPVQALLAPSPSDRDRQRAWNPSQTPFDASATVHALIAAQATRTPDATAVLQPGFGALSHGELQQRSNRLAHALRARGVARGAHVGLCVERGLDMLVAQLAILKAGAAYVPLDPAYPSERLTGMAEDAGLALLVSESACVQALRWPREKTLLLDVHVAAIVSMPDGPLAADAALDAQPQDPAYLIYTSGSTGTPKAVVVPHRAVLNLLNAMAREPGLKASDTLLAVTTLSFDIAVLELLLPLSVGAKTVLASREDALDGEALAALIQRHAVTVLQATPSSWRLLIESGWGPSPGLKALVGGESLSPDLAEQLLERCGELWNMYGPTETTVWSSCWRVEQPHRGIRIGRPIANTHIHILDERLQPCPIGVPGEICIGGEGLALGYHQRPELTAERFIANPEQPTQRLYRTGDRGRWCHDGTLEHQGRMDFQVKVRGHRIELGEIETRLLKHPSVARALVIAREDRPGDQRLVAYLVAQAAEAIEASVLREHLRASLPEHMLPQHLVEVDAIPLLPNGKLNRHALPAPTAAHESRIDGADFAQHTTATEQAIAGIWARLLDIDEVGRHDNFFNLGGHSLLALRAVLEIERLTGEKLAVRQLIFDPLSQIAAAVSVKADEDDSSEAMVAELNEASEATSEAPWFAARPAWLKRWWGQQGGDPSP